MLGGRGESLSGSKSVYTCSFSALLQSCSSRSLGAHHLANAPSPSTKTSVWSRVTDLPVTFSTCVSLRGRLLAVGGKDSKYKATTAVHMFDQANDSWTVTSHMTTPRCECFVAVLPDNQLMVVGGKTGIYDTDIVEITTPI